MGDIAGIPYIEAQFDKNGTLERPVTAAGGSDGPLRHLARLEQRCRRRPSPLSNAVHELRRGRQRPTICRGGAWPSSA